MDYRQMSLCGVLLQRSRWREFCLALRLTCDIERCAFQSWSFPTFCQIDLVQYAPLLFTSIILPIHEFCKNQSWIVFDFGSAITKTNRSGIALDLVPVHRGLRNTTSISFSCQFYLHANPMLNFIWRWNMGKNLEPFDWTNVNNYASDVWVIQVPNTIYLTSQYK